jgi:hypothetical protein
MAQAGSKSRGLARLLSQKSEQTDLAGSEGAGWGGLLMPPTGVICRRTNWRICGHLGVTGCPGIRTPR